MKTPKKKPSATNKNASEAKAGIAKPAAPKANSRIIDDEDEDEFDNSLDDLGALDDFASFDDDDDF